MASAETLLGRVLLIRYRGRFPRAACSDGDLPRLKVTFRSRAVIDSIRFAVKISRLTSGGNARNAMNSGQCARHSFTNRAATGFALATTPRWLCSGPGYEPGGSGLPGMCSWHGPGVPRGWAGSIGTLAELLSALGGAHDR